jgi:hypothetical protein
VGNYFFYLSPRDVYDKNMGFIKPSKNRDVREFENFHIVLWLLKDVCWVMGFKTMGTIMIIPTVTMAIYIAWLTRNSVVDLYHNLAVVCWITANSLWMLGELYFDGTTLQQYYELSRMVALILFILGLGFVFWYHFQKRLKK